MVGGVLPTAVKVAGRNTAVITEMTCIEVLSRDAASAIRLCSSAIAFRCALSFCAMRLNIFV